MLSEFVFHKAIIQMDQHVDQLDAGGGITDLVFDEKNHERKSWRFCNSRVPRSEIVYFTQVFIILVSIAISLIKLVFVNMILKKQHFGFLSCSVGCALPNPE